jgi:hypothetical protein
LTNRAYTIQTAAYIIGGVCFIVVAVLDTGAWTVVLGIIGLVMLVLALWRWYSVSAPRTSAQATHQRLDASWVTPTHPSWRASQPSAAPLAA